MLADSLESGNLEIQEMGNLESKKVKEINILNMKIRSAQNVCRALDVGRACLNAGSK